MNDKDIKILEYYLEQQDRKFVSEYRLEFLQAIENLLKENKELMKLKNDHNYSVDVVRENTKLRYELFRSVPVAKIKEIVDKCVPRGKNIITDEEEYQPNTNANSFLTHEILELLEGK